MKTKDQVMQTLTTLGRADVKQIARYHPDLWEHQIRNALYALKTANKIKIAATRKPVDKISANGSFHVRKMNIYEVVK